jgi:hypothetical protein
MIHRHLSGRDAQMGMSALLGVLQGDVTSGRVNLRELAREWRAANLPYDAAALVLIDGVVSRMKEVAELKPETENGMQLMLSYLERVIDAEFEANPSHIAHVAPFNGRIGQFCSSPRMAKYLKTT